MDTLRVVNADRISLIRDQGSGCFGISFGSFAQEVALRTKGDAVYVYDLTCYNQAKSKIDLKEY